MRRLLWMLGVALLVAGLVYAAHSQERFPGQQPGVPQPGEWDKANWTWQQHCWWLVHQAWAQVVPALVGLIGGGVLWRRSTRSAKGAGPTT